jgi:hypothetical protein
LTFIAAVIIVIFFIPYTASGFAACGKLFSSLFGFNYLAAMIISAVIIVAYCTLSPDQPYEAIEKADSYTLKLYAPNQTTPSAVIECKKMPSQTTPQAGQPRTYVGEIVKLLMKK